MPSAFISKLEHGCVLTDTDRARLTAITSATRTVAARQDVIGEGENPQDVHLVMEGIACRYKVLPGGQRQITALLLPGDFCDLHVSILGAMDHSIGTITACTLVEIPRTTVDDLAARSPRITRALWWATLVDEAILREWLVSMGRRAAERQLAHLFCELLARFQAAGRSKDQSYHLPLTQEDLADTLGLSVVHVNRSLQKLQSLGLIRLDRRRLTIVDLPATEALAGFDASYLHYREPARARAPQG